MLSPLFSENFKFRALFQVDWREKGFVTPPVNQLNCGSCYAFSIVHTVQGQILKLTGNLKFLRYAYMSVVISLDPYREK